MNERNTTSEPESTGRFDILGGVRKAIARAEAVQADAREWANQVEEHRRTLHSD